tara:strand:+ start:1844 stop:2299 length:456 start_codon:yes stop_codon:yes gene_type:complete
MKDKILIGCIIIALVTISSCSSNNSQTEKNSLKIQVYKAPSCGCCVGYIAELKKQGFEVETISMNDLTPLKTKYKIPKNMQSCHTAVIKNYFVEGHVPIEAIHKLIRDSPDIDGIALPRMPSGSPGMPGQKTKPFEIYSLTSGVSKPFLTI